MNKPQQVLIRLLAVLLAAMIALPPLLSLLINLWLNGPTAPQPTVVDSPYTATGPNVIHSGTGHSFSLTPYYFYNDDMVLPLSEGSPLKYRAGPVWYSFSAGEVDSLDSALEAHPEVTFLSSGGWKRVLRDKNDLFLCLAEKSWPFNQKKKICTLPSEDAFFSPVRVDGAEELAILVLSGQTPSQPSSIQVYCLQGRTWAALPFLLPGQPETSEFYGWARRHIDPEHRDVPLLPVGLLELGREQEDGSMALYSVEYQAGLLVLTLLPDEPELSPDLWHF